MRAHGPGSGKQRETDRTCDLLQGAREQNSHEEQVSFGFLLSLLLLLKNTVSRISSPSPLGSGFTWSTSLTGWGSGQGPPIESKTVRLTGVALHHPGVRDCGAGTRTQGGCHPHLWSPQGITSLFFFPTHYSLQLYFKSAAAVAPCKEKKF